jgi:putative DNA methylase
MKAPKKLIEVALPLDDINREAAREKSIRHGHPSTLHLWWARRPLAAARAVLFAQLVNDPGGERGWDSRKGVTKESAAAERERLFGIIRRLVKWENSNDPELLEEAREEIRRSWRETCAMNKGIPGFDPDRLPAFHDPFAGGGAIPLEAQRLGLESYASDLNPVAVAINKAMIEIPPRFAGLAPVGPLPPGESAPTVPDYPSGLAEDVRRYGLWMREEAKKRIGSLYPEVQVTRAMAEGRPDLLPYIGKKLTVIAWLWARTVPSPHPAYSHVQVPLVSSFVLSSKPGKEAWVEPIVEGDSYRFEIRTGKPPKDAEKGTTQGKRKGFRCLISGLPIGYDYIRTQGRSGNLACRLMTIVCEGDRGRLYLSPRQEHEEIAQSHKPTWRPTSKVPDNPREFHTPTYGLITFDRLFSDRQLIALNTFSTLIQDVAKKAFAEAQSSGQFPEEALSLADGGTGSQAYADAIAIYLAFAVDKCADYWSTICSWHSSGEKMRNTFGRQAIPMTWDYAECNPLCNSTGNWMAMVDWIREVLDKLPSSTFGEASQADAQTQTISQNKLISTDPPYYDNIDYANLSDFFYVWLRRNLRGVFPSLFSTMTTPKAEELVAESYRHGGVEKAEAFFLDGMTSAMRNLAARAHPAFPVTIYYAFKQSETNESGTGNAGWETFLEALIRSGFVITGTWPMRTELGNRVLSSNRNVLASSIVLVCRKRDPRAPSTDRRGFLAELADTMTAALQDMTGLGGKESPVAPVDLAQAAIGPGMEVFSKYAAVLNADGSKMTVGEAIRLINAQLDTDDFDAQTRFCREWLATHGWEIGPFGDADTLARGKGTTVDYVRDAGVLESGGGKVRLLRWEEYPEDYDPTRDRNRPAWEACHHLVRVLRRRGPTEAGKLLAQMPEAGESARALAYSLYVLCERKGMTQEAAAYNELVTAWNDILTAATEFAATQPKQGTLF